eukprot:Protomagalhaensia_sp_Gyna_25__889@NODE_142_length_4920_cov_484_660930_g112_i0_p3_GENE_NODE_142_length_4920_cov_484_660930_g112_i0NODE_142_length_4920_cov_484_660930_g112_i0_p3_ORF_typecomplete_len170_score14_59_NODE_142_length_4920_cov_484_660930_g112_i042654774
MRAKKQGTATREEPPTLLATFNLVGAFVMSKVAPTPRSSFVDMSVEALVIDENHLTLDAQSLMSNHDAVKCKSQVNKTDVVPLLPLHKVACDRGAAADPPPSNTARLKNVVGYLMTERMLPMAPTWTQLWYNCSLSLIRSVLYFGLIVSVVMSLDALEKQRRLMLTDGA